jgi:hypothetical protein
MRGYTVNGPSASGTGSKTAVSIVGGTGVRFRIYEFTAGLTTAPNSTDQQLEFALGRWTTSAGTAGSSPTPNPVDPADVASTATAGITHSAEPTYAATYFVDQAMNQRALFRWVAVPGYEFINPATATTGIGLKNVAITAASVITGTVMFFE